MSVVFERNNKTLKAVFQTDRTLVAKRIDVSSLCSLEDRHLDTLLEHAKRKIDVITNAKTKNHACSALQAFGRFLSCNNVTSFPKYSDIESWQHLVSHFYIWHISEKKISKAKLSTRCKTWSGSILSLLSSLSESGFIHSAVLIPSGSLPKGFSDGSPLSPVVLGQSAVTKTNLSAPIEKPPIDKTLAGPIFWLSDPEYLDQVESTIRQRNSILEVTLDDYWGKLSSDMRSGKELMAMIPDTELHSRIKNNDWKVNSRGTGVASPGCAFGSHWALKLMEYNISNTSDELCISAANLRKHPAFSTSFLNGRQQTPLGTLLQRTALNKQQAEIIPASDLLYRFLGVFSLTDMAVAMAIIIQEHPNINPESIAGAKLLNSGNKYHLLMADNDKIIFSVDKPRANSRKYAVLTPRAQSVMKDIISATKLTRNLLRRSGNKHLRFLFIGLVGIANNKPGLGHPALISSNKLNEPGTGFSLARAYPELAKNNLTVGTLSFKKIRTTQGVLAWFNEGSIQACSRKLGNSLRVTVEHYIPRPLLDAWNERIIRRFQNTLIVLSCHDEDYLLEVVDMPTMTELHGFLAQLIYELPKGRSPIADQLHQKFGKRFFINADTSQPKEELTKKCLLNVRLHPSSLALVLAYREWALLNLTTAQQEIADTNGVSPEQFINLGSLIQSVAQNGQVSESLSSSFNVSALRRTYQKALVKVPDYVDKLSRQAIQLSNRW